jgi:hypothetical protein
MAGDMPQATQTQAKMRIKVPIQRPLVRHDLI